MESKPSGVIALRNSFLLRQKRFTVSAVQMYPNKYNKHKSRCILKSRGRRSLYKHTNIPHVMEKRQNRELLGGKENMGGNENCTVVEEESRRLTGGYGWLRNMGSMYSLLKKGDSDESNWCREKLTLYSMDFYPADVFSKITH